MKYRIFKHIIDSENQENNEKQLTGVLILKKTAKKIQKPQKFF